MFQRQRGAQAREQIGAPARAFPFLCPLLVFVLPFIALGQMADPTMGGRYYGTTGDRLPYDTSATRETRIRTEQTSLLLERAIDPATYRVGPNDVLLLALPMAEARPVELSVFPDGTVVVPRVGSVNVNGRTLRDASEVILRSVGQVYRTGGASVSLRAMRQFKVTVLGDVRRPGMVVATPSTRVSEAIDLAGGASTTANRRGITLTRSAESMQVDLLPFYTEGRLEANPVLEGGDVLFVGVQDPANITAIFGAVNRGGEFDYRPGDSVTTLLRAAFGVTADAIRDSILLVSVSPNGDTLAKRRLRLLSDGTVMGNQPLYPGDRVFVPRNPFYYRTNKVVVVGEVRRPGSFPVIPGRTRLSEIVQQFGGFTPEASLRDAVVIRRSDFLNQVDQKLKLIQEVDPDKRSEEDVEYLRNKATERPGVMTVSFVRLLNGVTEEDISLEDKDSIVVPTAKGYVKVAGKVKNPGNITYSSGAGYAYYIARAGGYGWRAEEGETKVIKSGSSDTYSANDEGDYQIEPGDQIFVPEQKEGDFWGGFTQAITIVAQIGTIVAVILSIRGQ